MRQPRTRTIRIFRVEDQGDRVLCYPQNTSYHIIAARGTKVHPGDTIEYEPDGFNFGWFVAIHTDTSQA